MNVGNIKQIKNLASTPCLRSAFQVNRKRIHKQIIKLSFYVLYGQFFIYEITLVYVIIFITNQRN